MKGSTSFLLLLVVIVGIIAGHNSLRYYLNKGYPIHAVIACNPTMHTCFVADPATADPAYQTEPYAKVVIDNANAPKCLDEHTCTDFSCIGITGCSIEYCSASTTEDGESCSTQAP